MSQHKKKQRHIFPATPASARVPVVSVGNARVQEDLPITPLEPTKDLADFPSNTPVVKSAEPIVDEVQAFLRQRQELAQRLAEEIALTEQKLVALKRTAALLAPEAPRGSAGTKDRKGKKAPRGVKRPEKAVTGEPTSQLVADE